MAEQTLGERIHQMQLEDRRLSFLEIDDKLGETTSGMSVYRYAGWALVEIERLRAENADLRREWDILEDECGDGGYETGGEG